MDETFMSGAGIVNAFASVNSIAVDDNDLYITHCARYIDSSSQKYWELPFSQDFSSYTDCACATTSNISLTGLQTIDGVVLSGGERVLVKNQSDASQNGIYISNSSAWSRASDLKIGRAHV